MTASFENVILLTPDDSSNSVLRNALDDTAINYGIANKPEDIDPPSSASHSMLELVLIDDEIDESVLVNSWLGDPNADNKHRPSLIILSRSKKCDLKNLLANVFITLPKPLVKETLIRVMEAAINNCRFNRNLLDQMEKRVSAIGLIKSGVFEVQNFTEARNLTTMLSLACPSPDEVVLGLNELLQNAIEHGNLEIGYEKKSELLANGTWLDEITHRLTIAPYQKRYVNVKFKRADENIIITIKDQGKGFDWRNYIEISSNRLSDSHGRGIAFAAMMAFNKIEYNEIGNMVTIHI